MPADKWLAYYAKVFDFVEVDSTFYATPTLFMVRRWTANTPSNFNFTVKLSRIISHNKAFYDAEKYLESFYSSLAPLKEKTLAFLIQIPPSLSFKTGYKLLSNFLGILDQRYRYCVEARQTSWFNEEFYALLKDNKVCLCWNQLDSIQAPPVVTSDFVYIRLIGDRSIDDKDFGRIQRDRLKEMEYGADEIRKANLQRVIVAANNHYAGFGPGTANMMRKLLALEEVDWRDREQSRLPF